uniref:SSD domain-containing protein n=1 Tax=Timema shepardi TaxID=629360 RepID=A0A7R9FXQ9_TIMSH|nr:unnamed protein product [Timema shepardi]
MYLGEIHQRVVNISNSEVSWEDVCFRIPVIDFALKRKKRQMTDNQTNPYDQLGNEDFFDQSEPDLVFDPSVILSEDIYCAIVNNLKTACLERSLLEFWEYDPEVLKKITKEDIISALNITTDSPVFGHPMSYTHLLGGIKRNETGYIVSASSLMMFFLVHVNFSAVNMEESGNDAGTADWNGRYTIRRELVSLRRELERAPAGSLSEEEGSCLRMFVMSQFIWDQGIVLEGSCLGSEGWMEKWAGGWATGPILAWEKMFLQVMADISYDDKEMKIFYEAGRSSPMTSLVLTDSSQLTSDSQYLGIMKHQHQNLNFKYFDKPNTFSQRSREKFFLGIIGLLSVGMAFVVACGICSLFGIPYGPVHTALPFLLMGIGVDDVFVIMACWKNLTSTEKKLILPEKIALTMQYAGSSITVTSMTDVIAFLVGAFTILPSLQSFCLYAAVGVFVTFVFQATLFVACLVLDERRIQKSYNGIVICYKHQNHKPCRLSQRECSKSFFHALFSNVILTLPGKFFKHKLHEASMSNDIYEGWCNGTALGAQSLILMIVLSVAPSGAKFQKNFRFEGKLQCGYPAPPVKVNVAGMMFYWGLTIDIVSCIGLELASGLCVDYAAHVGHNFLTCNGSNNNRALKVVTDMGSAIIEFETKSVFEAEWVFEEEEECESGATCDRDEEQGSSGSVPALPVTERRGTGLLWTCSSAACDRDEEQSYAGPVPRSL